MRRFLFVPHGIIPKESVTWRHVSEEEFLGPGMYTSAHNELIYTLNNIIL